MCVAVFFDLGDTLVIPRLSDDGSLLGLNVLPFVPDVLAKLKTKTNDAVLRLREVISNTGTETLSKMRWLIAEAGLLDFFEPALLLSSSVEESTNASSSSLSWTASVRACRRSIASTLARMTPSAGSPHWLSFARHIIHCTFST
jgi:hypothetical protein